MKLKREQIKALAVGIDRINKSEVKLPFRINYAVQRSYEAIKSEVAAIDKTMKDVSDEFSEKVKAAQREYADRDLNDKGENIPLIKNDRYICTKRESELGIVMNEIGKESVYKSKEISSFMEEEVEVGLHQFSVSKDDEKKLEELGGNLAGIMVLIKDVSE